ncbi:MAG: TRL domain-containing protein [Thermodesulfobacteriota bacterium]
MKNRYLAVVLFIVVLVQGCAYSHVQRPLDINYDRTSLGTKVGRSHTQSVLWLLAWGDGGTRTAAKNGGITNITHADIEFYMILFGLYTRTTTVLYGD